MSNEISVPQETLKNVTIHQIAGPFTLGEGPHWDPVKKEILFVDILDKTVNKYNIIQKKHDQLPLNEEVSLIIPVKDVNNKYVITQGQNLELLTWNETTNTHSIKTLKTVSSKEEEEAGNQIVKTRINDGKADHLGNIWFGTMSKEAEGTELVKGAGSFYRLSINGKLDTIATSVSISNGIGWNSNKTLMYFIDSLERRVDVFDFDPTTATASNRREFFDFEKNKITGLPDGMTTDEEDNLWIACWGGFQVIKVSGKTGKLIGSLKLPAGQITSVIFGGDNLDVLFVTSARYKLTEQQLKEQPYAGYMFSVSGLGVKGVSSNSAVIPSF